MSHTCDWGHSIQDAVRFSEFDPIDDIWTPLHLALATLQGATLEIVDVLVRVAIYACPRIHPAVLDCLFPRGLDI